MNCKRTLLGVCAAALLASTPAWGAEAGTARRDSALMRAPFRDAETVGALARGDKVEILRRQGGWYRVKSGKRTGWVRMLSIQRSEARKGRTDASSVAALASGRAGTGRVVATTGIRGLNEEELKLARHDAAELRKLEGHAVGRAEAERFAGEGRLSARGVE